MLENWLTERLALAADTTKSHWIMTGWSWRERERERGREVGGEEMTAVTGRPLGKYGSGHETAAVHHGEAVKATVTCTLQ